MFLCDSQDHGLYMNWDDALSFVFGSVGIKVRVLFLFSCHPHLTRELNFIFEQFTDVLESPFIFHSLCANGQVQVCCILPVNSDHLGV